MFDFQTSLNIIYTTLQKFWVDTLEETMQMGLKADITGMKTVLGIDKKDISHIY